MATHIIESNHSALLPGQAQAEIAVEQTRKGFDGGAFRGLLFAMLFNIFLFLIGAGLWELWRVMR
jgi:hypothetical protein